MLEFKKVSDMSDIKKIKKYIEETDSHFSTLNLPGFLVWRNLYPREYCIVNDTLVLREYNPDGKFKSHFFMPMGRDIPKVLDQIEEYCRKTCTELVFANLTHEEAHMLEDRYPINNIFYDRSWSDYIYLAEDMRSFAGKKFSGQRNHINKFKKFYGEHVYNEITPQNKDDVLSFLKEYAEGKSLSTDTEKEELQRIPEIIENFEELGMVGGFVTVDNKIIALSMGMVKSDMLFVNVEKADRSFEGAYQIMVQEFAKHNTDDNVLYINREDDMGLPGLRTSKLQYKPIEIKHKYYLHALTLFDSIKPEEKIKGERISLDDISAKDADDFFRLSTDTENNKYWGYDFNEDKDFINTPDYFIQFVQTMKETKEEYSLAIRYEDTFAGEIVFHNFDYKKGVEIGIRLLPEFQGLGLGTEAVKLASEYARKVGAEQIKMKCFKENNPSYNMIKKAHFKETCTDDTHIHFVL